MPMHDAESSTMQPFSAGILTTFAIAFLASFSWPGVPFLDVAHWPPLVIWAVKGIGGVIVLQTCRRLWDVYVLDKFFPDHRSKPSLLERIRNRRLKK